MNGEGVHLSDEEAELVWMLLYNILSQGDWPEGLDVPKDVPGHLEKYNKLLEKLMPK
jgi:hypothetical protein